MALHQRNGKLRKGDFCKNSVYCVQVVYYNVTNSMICILHFDLVHSIYPWALLLLAFYSYCSIKCIDTHIIQRLEKIQYNTPMQCNQCYIQSYINYTNSYSQIKEKQQRNTYLHIVFAQWKWNSKYHFHAMYWMCAQLSVNIFSIQTKWWAGELSITFEFKVLLNMKIIWRKKSIVLQLCRLGKYFYKYLMAILYRISNFLRLPHVK